MKLNFYLIILLLSSTGYAETLIKNQENGVEQNVGDVVLHGLLADKERLPDFAVSLSGGHLFQNFHLTFKGFPHLTGLGGGPHEGGAQGLSSAAFSVRVGLETAHAVSDHRRRGPTCGRYGPYGTRSGVGRVGRLLEVSRAAGRIG